MDVTELAMLLESMDLTPVDAKTFMAAAEKAKKFKLEDDQKLQLYGLFKQSTVGNVNTPPPEAAAFVERAKWDAWKAYEGFPRESASMAYVYIIDQMEASGKEEAVGSADRQPSHFISAVSTLIGSEPNDKFPEDMKLLNLVIENDIEAVRSELLAGANVDLRNEEGMTALHFAADRGFLEMVTLLLAHGANSQLEDAEGQKPLDFAILCEHDDIVDLLQKFPTSQECL